jgi:MFS family permease
MLTRLHVLGAGDRTAVIQPAGIMETLDKKIFGTLFFSLFVTVTGVGIVVPLLPVYAHDLGARGLAIGLIFGAFAISRTLFLPYFGALSDRKGRKPLIITGLFAYAIISLVFIAVVDVNGLIFIRFLQGIASAMIMPVVQAYVGEITPHGREGFTMGMFNTSVFLGLSLGPVVGGVINDSFSLDAAFLSMGLLALLGFLFSTYFLPPTREEKTVARQNEPVPWRRILTDRDIFGLFIFRLAYTACIGIVWGFLPIFADTEFSLSSAPIGILVMLGVFISGIIQLPMGYLADRINRRAMVTVGGVIVCVAMLAMSRAGGFWDLVWASVIFGIGGGVAMPAHMALGVVKGNDTEAMGSVMSLLTMAHSMGMLLGSILAGALMDLFDLRIAFPFGAGMMLCCTLFFWFFSDRGKAPVPEKAA